MTKEELIAELTASPRLDEVSIIKESDCVVCYFSSMTNEHVINFTIEVHESQVAKIKEVFGEP